MCKELFEPLTKTLNIKKVFYTFVPKSTTQSLYGLKIANIQEIQNLGHL
jgi:hypothetical protein